MPHRKKHPQVHKHSARAGMSMPKNNVAIHAIASKQANIIKSISKILLLSSILSLASFTIYSNTLSNGYVMDDIEVYQNNVYVTQGIKGIPQILTTTHLKGFMAISNETYRPLSLVMFAIEYQFFGANPAVNHFFNILVFIGCVLMLFFFLNNLFDKKSIILSFVACLIFSFHPIHTEVVANIKSRDELLGFFFAFLALNIFLVYYRDGKLKHYWLGLLFLFLAFISKETVITFISFVPMIFYFYKNENKKRSLYLTLGTFGVALIFIGIRFLILVLNHNQLAHVTQLDNYLVAAPTYAAKFATAIFILGNYFKLLLIPNPLISDYSLNSIPFKNFQDWGVWLSIFAYSLLTYLGLYRLFKIKKDPWAFAIFIYLICLSLFTNIVFHIGSCMSERFVFYSSAGICLLMALTICKLSSSVKNDQKGIFKNYKTWAFLLPILIIYGKLTYARNAEWKNNYTLYTADLKKSPDNSRLNYCVGYELVANSNQSEFGGYTDAKSRIETGVNYLRKSLTICPENLNAHVEIGNAFFLLNQTDSAKAHDLIALQYEKNDPIIYNNLAGVYFKEKNYPKALEYCKLALTKSPSFVNAIKNQGLCFSNMNESDSAIFYFKAAIKAAPTQREFYFLTANAYKSMAIIDSYNKYQSLGASQ